MTEENVVKGLAISLSIILISTILSSSLFFSVELARKKDESKRTLQTSDKLV